MLGIGGNFLRLFPIVPSGLMVKTFSSLMLRFPKQMIRMMGNYDNFDPETLKDFLTRGLVNVSPRKTNQYLIYLKRQVLSNKDGTINYSARLKDIKNPILLISGEKDAFVPPKTVKKTYERIGSAEKRWINFSIPEGYSTNYGHADLLLGKNAYQEVFPIIRDFLL